MAFALLKYSPIMYSVAQVEFGSYRAVTAMKELKRILVIDDDTITRESVAEVLQEEGYEVADRKSVV